MSSHAKITWGFEPTPQVAPTGIPAFKKGVSEKKVLDTILAIIQHPKDGPRPSGNIGTWKAEIAKELPQLKKKVDITKVDERFLLLWACRNSNIFLVRQLASGGTYQTAIECAIACDLANEEMRHVQEHSRRLLAKRPAKSTATAAAALEFPGVSKMIEIDGHSYKATFGAPKRPTTPIMDQSAPQPDRQIIDHFAKASKKSTYNPRKDRQMQDSFVQFALKHPDYRKKPSPELWEDFMSLFRPATASSATASARSVRRTSRRSGSKQSQPSTSATAFPAPKRARPQGFRIKGAAAATKVTKPSTKARSSANGRKSASKTEAKTTAGTTLRRTTRSWGKKL